MGKPSDRRQPGSGAARVPIANLKIARFNGQRLTYAGAVGTGFSDRVATALRVRLEALRAPRCAVPGLKVSGAVWVVPDLRAEIAFCGVIGAGELRHASFKGVDGLSLRVEVKALDVRQRNINFRRPM